MGYRLLEVELAGPVPSIRLGPEETGCAIVARHEDEIVGFRMIPARSGATLEANQLEPLLDASFARAVLARRARRELERLDGPAPPLPTLTVAICTKDRAARLSRLLASLRPLREASPFPSTEVIVVDNASAGPATREAVQTFPEVRYRFEAKAGLNFARNAALAAASGDLIAFLDDDVVVDRGWLAGLARAWRSLPAAGGFTGLVLPFRLDTEAQVFFEARGGFGRGFERREFARTSADFPLHPAGAGLLGAGCNMAFDRSLLLEIGGFDEALDTGAPLPGGGDLDIFYRVLRAGRKMVYEPSYAVRHEHRETLTQLKRQYWSWGLGMMAFLAKSWRSDPDYRAVHRALVRWWILDVAKDLAKAGVRMRLRELRFRWAEFAGGVQGLLGEYDRSLRRSRRIRSMHP